MNIDMSKKPEGATHYAMDPRAPDGIQWYLLKSGEAYKFWSGIVRPSWVVGAGRIEEPAKDFYPITTPARNGEGRPPVGTVCEYQTTSWPPEQWEIRTVRYISDYHVVTAEQDGTERSVSADVARFRPIRTPEQIAAEERQKKIQYAISELGGERLKVLYPNATESRAFTEAIVSAMIDLGYRKQAAE